MRSWLRIYFIEALDGTFGNSSSAVTGGVTRDVRSPKKGDLTMIVRSKRSALYSSGVALLAVAALLGLASPGAQGGRDTSSPPVGPILLHVGETIVITPRSLDSIMNILVTGDVSARVVKPIPPPLPQDQVWVTGVKKGPGSVRVNGVAIPGGAFTQIYIFSVQ